MNMPIRTMLHVPGLGIRSIGLTALWLVCWLVLARSSAAASSVHYRVGVLISRLPFDQAVEGLREGLGQLGYHEQENLAFMIENAHGEVAIRGPSTPSITSLQVWWAHIDLLIRKSKEDKIPLTVHEDSMVEQGGLVSYGANIRLIGVQAAKIMAKILKGVKPAEIPVQTPEKLALAINLTTAKAISVDIPRSVLERTDRLVE
jgi:ABC-type uncharacterized transport system substrate-binding protein